ncbi:hypothetical protein G6F46_012120 [Rhizopus delemar]|uniref:Uncharacterized protein n=2 Tax=Rhizopus TaxID=4842 RepID=A0A9P6YS94_9FUNG|nr:hypothetical protein G6F43_012322 [Rhizopus delemar]KAG1534579.1 hypothetical protein G6F51_012019 [Rhizopus arrhizus]KAG1445816.1 hypothetical protein G6F55_011803 [Rhizopus delemar]KAG1488992.1 hypothetical protein G6F54_011760 [Rhizopus delemar]KAG1497883.1 hypothetical protein G6F53_011867 [Rhizopus delemar]
MFDVGGQRIAISGYDQRLVEDKDANQMHESLMLFDNIYIFKKKILISPISKWFPDFEGDNHSYEQTVEYFKRRFQRLNQNDNKLLYIHYTDATDTNLLQHVMEAVSDTILNENLNTLML